jgi:hypothetical protein
LKLTEKRACAQPTRKSGTSASPSPPPIAGPWIAPTAGFVQAKRRTASKYSGLTARGLFCSGVASRFAKFAPAQNDAPCEQSTIARHAGSASSASKASAMPRIIGMSK